MNENRYDLHCHSVYSDGTKTVTELFEIATSLKLAGISITDHDTIKAYDEAIGKVQDYPLKLLPGIEISSALNGLSVHVLAYGFSPNDPLLNRFIENLQKERWARNLKIIAKLKEANMPLDLNKLKEDIGVIGRPHIASAMLKLGYVKSIREAFNEYIGEGQKCFVPGFRPEVPEVLEFLHKVRAFGIIAHPHLIKNNRLVKELLSQPFDGLEAYYAHFPSKDEKKWVRLADNRDWIKTGGSDFHGEIKPYISLGGSWVREDTFQLLYQRYLENERLQAIK